MTKGRVLFAFIALSLLAVVFLFSIGKHTIDIPGPVGEVVKKVAEVVPPPPPPLADPNADIENQPQLAHKPDVVKAIYATGYSAGSEKKIEYFLDLLNTTELNAIVIDIKDYTGAVSYKTDIEAVNKYDAWERKILKINALIKRFHDAGVYVIGRIAVFQDQALVKARPDLALHSSSTGAVWADYKGVKWMETASPEVWDYNAAIAADAIARGFDEINFDYIRFPSDGNLKDIKYNFFDETTLKHNTVKKFFERMREKLPNARLSADLFGLVTETSDGMGIGQVLEDGFAPFDFIAPMAYPSHYAKGYRGFATPATHPYEVMKFAMDAALSRLSTYNLQVRAANEPAPSSTAPVAQKPEARARFRPWLQDFDLGADYTPAMVRAQVQAIYDAGCESAASSTPRYEPCSKEVDGFMVWNPSNVYTKEAFLKE